MLCVLHDDEEWIPGVAGVGAARSGISSVGWTLFRVEIRRSIIEVYLAWSETLIPRAAEWSEIASRFCRYSEIHSATTQHHCIQIQCTSYWCYS